MPATRHSTPLVTLAALALVTLVVGSAVPVERAPPCECDAFTDGMVSSSAGDLGCMKWHKNNAFRTDILISGLQGGTPTPGAIPANCLHA